jgi:hypothetical protein
MLEYLKKQFSTLFTNIGSMFTKAYSYFFGTKIIPATKNITTAATADSNPERRLTEHSTVVISAVPQYPVTTLTKYIKPQSETALSNVLNNYVSPQNKSLNINAYLGSTAEKQLLRQIAFGRQTDLHIYRQRQAVTAAPRLLLEDKKTDNAVQPLKWSNSPLVSRIQTRDATYFKKPKLDKMAPK